MYYIYKATNTINGKVYIGQTVDFKRRKAEHNSSKNGVHAKCVFHKAIQKYGKHNFEWEIIDKCKTLNEALRLESKYIVEYNSCVAFPKSNGYNIILMDEKASVVHNSQKVIAYNLNGEYVGIYASAEQAARELKCIGTNIDKVLKGIRKSTGGYMFRKYTENYPLKIEKYTNNELESKYKAVYQYTPSLSLIKKYHSLFDCALELGVNRNTITRSIKENRLCKGYKFSFVEL